MRQFCPSNVLKAFLLIPWTYCILDFTLAHSSTCQDRLYHSNNNQAFLKLKFNSGPIERVGFLEYNYTIGIIWRKLYMDLDILAITKAKRLNWLGHVYRRQESTRLIESLMGMPTGKIPFGRPRLR